MTTTAATFEHQGRTYEIRRYEEMTRIDNNGGAAPWMVGRRTLDVRFKVFLNDEYVMDCGYNRKHPDMSIRQIKESLNA